MTPAPAEVNPSPDNPNDDESGRLVWIDLEMTGLDPSKERIIEIATLITDANLELIAEGPELVIHQPDSLLDKMDAWNQRQHGGSGLTERVRTSKITERDAEKQTLAFIAEHCAPNRAVLAGNSVHHDRRFLLRAMPKIVDHLHYRIVDVSTVKELARRWYPSVLEQCPPKPESHRALDDIRASVAELRFYRDSIFRTRE